MRRSTKQKKTPLLAGMVAIVIAFWVLPSSLMLLAFNYVSSRNVYANVSSLINSAVDSAAASTQRNLDNIVSDSFNLNYSGTLRMAFADYHHNNDPAQEQFVTDQLSNSMNQFLTQEYGRSDSIKAVMINMLDGSGLSFHTYNPTRAGIGNVTYYQRHVLERALRLADEPDNEIHILEADGHVYMVRSLVSFLTNYEPYAIMAIELIPDTIAGSFFDLSYLRSASLQVNGTPLIVASETDEEGMLVVEQSLQGGHFMLDYHILTDPSELLGQERQWNRLLILIIILLIPMTAVVILFFHRQVSRPIRLLSEQSREVEAGHFGVQVDTRQMGSREFTYLGTNFNTMSDKLLNQFEHIYREELSLRDARLKALQSQINPHFLGNTLEIINWEARLAGNDKVSSMLEALSTMLKATTNREQAAFITLEEELSYTDAYLYIIHERMGRRLTIIREIDETLLSWQLPRLILQPIVENAVEHGAFPNGQSTITIRARSADRRWIILEVENDRTLSAEDEAKIAALLDDEADGPETSVNIGIRNVHQRLRLYFGPESGLSITNTPDGHTLSTMHIGVKPE